MRLASRSAKLPAAACDSAVERLRTSIAACSSTFAAAPSASIRDTRSLSRASSRCDASRCAFPLSSASFFSRAREAYRASAAAMASSSWRTAFRSRSSASARGLNHPAPRGRTGLCSSTPGPASTADDWNNRLKERPKPRAGAGASQEVGAVAGGGAGASELGTPCEIVRSIKPTRAASSSATPRGEASRT